MRLKADIHDVKKQGEDSAGDASMQLAALRGQVRSHDDGPSVHPLVGVPLHPLPDLLSLLMSHASLSPPHPRPSLVQLEESERRISAQEAATSEAKSAMSAELETRMGVFATDIESVRSAVSDQTKQTADILEQADATRRDLAASIQSKSDELAASIKGLEQQLATTSESISAVKSDVGAVRDQGVASAGRLDQLQAEVSETQSASTRGLQEAGGRLDALEGNLARLDAIEEAATR